MCFLTPKCKIPLKTNEFYVFYVFLWLQEVLGSTYQPHSRLQTVM